MIVEVVQNTTPLCILIPHFEEVGGGVEPWSMTRWKALAEFLLSVIELLFLSLTVEALQGTRSPAIAEGPRDAGVPVEIW